MKKNIKNILCLVLALAMALSLAACGGGEQGEEEPRKENAAEKAEHPDFVYTSEFIPIDAEDVNYMFILGIDGENIYCSAEKTVGKDIPEGAVESYEGQFNVTENYIYKVSADGKLSPLPGYVPLEKPEDEDKPLLRVYGGIYGLIIRDNGELVTLENQSLNWYTGSEENVDMDSEEYWNNMAYENRYYIRVLSADGSELSRAMIETEPDTYVDTRSFVEDGQGNILLNMDPILRAVKPDGSTAYEVDLNGQYLDRVYRLSDGRIAAMLYGEAEPGLYLVDTESRSIGERFELPYDAYELVPGRGDYEFCYSSGLYLYGLNLGQEPVKLLNWLDANVNSDTLNGFAIGPDDSVLGFRMEYSDKKNSYDYELFHMTKQPYDSVPQKQELTLGVQWLDYQIKDLIIDYNRSSDKYKIVVKDYSEFNTEDNYEAGRTKMLTEIMSGDMPDILALGGMPYEQLAAKGLIEDIYPYIEADPELKNARFVDNFFKALEVDGKLCQVVSSFGINTASGSPKAVGTEPGWNYQEFQEALSNMPEGCAPFPKHMTRSNMLSICLAMDMGLYADWITGQCSFDSPEFIELLEFCRQFPEEYEWTEEDAMIDEGELISSGQQMLTGTYIYSFSDMQYNDIYFRGESTFIGYPSASGNGSAFSFPAGYAISRSCENKEAAWDFLRSLLTEEYQDNLSYSLPTNMASFEKGLEDAMTPEYEKDPDGNFLLDENGEKIPVSMGSIIDSNGNEYQITAVTQSQADRLMELINSTTKIMDESSQIVQIVLEEAEPFYKGQKSAQEVAKLIQSKVNIYINEQR